MEKHERKSHPINRNIGKLKRFITGKEPRSPHKLYPEEYFKQYWFNEPDSNGIDLIARIKEVPKKEAAHIIFVEGFKKIMGQLVKEELDQMDTPKEQAKIAKHTKFYLELRRLCREQGWNINKLFK